MGEADLIGWVVVEVALRLRGAVCESNDGPGVVVLDEVVLLGTDVVAGDTRRAP